MNKAYMAVTKTVEIEWDSEDVRANLNCAMKFAEHCIRKGIAVKITCNGEFIWSSDDWK